MLPLLLALFFICLIFSRKEEQQKKFGGLLKTFCFVFLALVKFAKFFDKKRLKDNYLHVEKKGGKKFCR